MSSPEAAPSVKRTARLKQQGEKYTLFLLENGTPVETKIIESKEDKIGGLGLIDEDGFPIPGAKYSMVTKGSSLELDDGNCNKYEVENETPFDAANGEFCFGSFVRLLLNLFRSSLANN
ncbi:hypothetical protein SEMRO_602_G173810.1 [Seminavis robusta]|uniref:Uncharacterized protein n=1 Tax=Seminavis robusta TaxID=568900 RepID=A0A9N8E2Y5_9STRA|nr:hypothetical protein SEMRO_602_G173810.1 [Seminavis robusta]|eukprot:Sro602_g173810.1 n/a (119) ;mRNA; r:52819-53175